jgi:hypothetical protein
LEELKGMVTTLKEAYEYINDIVSEKIKSNMVKEG